MPDAKYIDMVRLRAALVKLGGLGESVAYARNHIVGCWGEVDSFPALLEELPEEPSERIGRILTMVCDDRRIMSSCDPDILLIIEELQTITDLYNGLEMRDSPEQICEDLILVIRTLGATDEDVERVKSELKLTKNRERPISVFAREIKRFQQMKGEQDAVEKEGK